MTTVLVTAVGSFSPAAVIRAARRLDWRAVGCDLYPRSWIANALSVDAFCPVPPARSGEPYIAAVLDFCRGQKVDYIVPTTDDEVDVLGPVRERLREESGARLCLSEQPDIELFRHKARLAAFLEANSLCRTIPTVSAADLPEDPDLHGLTHPGAAVDPLSAGQIGAWRYPLVLKPSSGRSSQGLKYIETAPELAFELGRIAPADRRGYLIQPRITGDIIAVDVFRDPRTECCAALARRELLRTWNGAGTTVRVFRDPALESVCNDMARAMRVVGTVCFEFIAAADGYYFLECNPRFSGGVEFSEMAGFDCVANHLRLFAGEAVQAAGDHRELTIARRYEAYITDESGV